MEPLPFKFKVIKTVKQYNDYCWMLEGLVVLKKKTAAERDVIELLEVLIKKYGSEQNTFTDAGSIEALRYLMGEHKLKSVELAAELNISTSLLSAMLHRHRGLSKENIRKLAARFAVGQELFNRPYTLTPAASRRGS